MDSEVVETYRMEELLEVTVSTKKVHTLLTTLVTSFNKVATRVNEETAKVAQCTAQNRELMAEMDGLRRSNDILQGQVHECKEELVAIRGRSGDLTVLREELRSVDGVQQTEIDKLKRIEGQHASEAEAWRFAIDTLKAKHVEQEDELDATKKALRSEHSQVTDLEDTVAALQRQLESIKREGERQETTLTAKKFAEELDKRDAAHQSALDAIRKQMGIAAAEATERFEELGKCEVVTRRLSAMEEDFARVFKTVEGLGRTTEEQQQEVSGVKGSGAVVARRMDELQEEIDAVRKLTPSYVQQSEWSAEVDRLNKSIIASSIPNGERIDQVSGSLRGCMETLQCLPQLQAHIESLHRQLGEERTRISELSTHTHELRNTVDSSPRPEMPDMTPLEDCQTRVEQCFRAVTELQTRLADGEPQAEGLQARFVEITEKVNQHRSLLEQVQRNAQEWEQVRFTMEGLQTRQGEQSQDIATTKLSAEHRMVAIEAEVKQLRGFLEDMLAEWREKFVQYSDSLQQFNAWVETVQNRSNEAADGIVALGTEYSTFQHAVVARCNEVEGLMQQLHQQLVTRGAEIEDLQQVHQNRGADIDDLYNVLEMNPDDVHAVARRTTNVTAAQFIHALPMFAFLSQLIGRLEILESYTATATTTTTTTTGPSGQIQLELQRAETPPAVQMYPEAVYQVPGWPADARAGTY